MSEKDIRRIAREENKPFLDRIMELQDTLKDREEYCNKLEEDRENILIENKKQKEVLDKIKEEIEKDIEFCKNDSAGVYDKCNIQIKRMESYLELLEEIE